MDLVQFSNLLNLAVQFDPVINSYQYGWTSDINTSRQNNFDPTGEVGKLYPYLLFQPPTVTFGGSRKYYQCKLVLFDLYGYKNNAGMDTRTMVEGHRDLTEAIQSLLSFLTWYGDNSKAFEIEGAVIGQLDGVAHDDQLLFLEIDFNLCLVSSCSEWNFDEQGVPAELAAYEPITKIDLEKQTADKWQP
ncbi:MAG: hypothetical protein IPN94_22990 [Sphingobacteriales bacterium]|nr:hypothetical protein [Sphingobacteriales bacterium]